MRGRLVFAAAVALALAGCSYGGLGPQVTAARAPWPPRPPHWRVSPTPPRLAASIRATYVDLAPAQGALLEIVEDAGDYNRDGLRDVLVSVDRPDRVGWHRRGFFVVLGSRTQRTTTLARALATRDVLRVAGPNPPLPAHASQIPASDADWDGWRDDAHLETDEVWDTYPCGGENRCVQVYRATRLVVTSNAQLAPGDGPLLFQFGGAWSKAVVGPYLQSETYGWVGDWNHDHRADLFVADAAGVAVVALTKTGVRKLVVNAIARPTGNQPYRPIALDITGDGRPELLGAGLHRGRLSLVIVASL